jgi:type II secretory pathway predicted ATPase ExeA
MLSYAALEMKSEGLKLINKTAIEEKKLGYFASYPFMPSVILRFINYVPGSINLGMLQVSHGGILVKEFPLGTTTATDTFVPPFFEHAEAFAAALNRIARIRDEVSGGGLRIAVIGRGGNGKTRLCQEAALRAEAIGFTTHSVRHPRHLKAPYQLLAELIDALLPAGDRQNLYDSAAILRFIRTYNAPLADAAAETVTFLMTQGAGGQASSVEAVGKVYNTRICARVLAFLMALAAKSSPLLLHLSDLHWAAPEVFNVLRQTFRIVDGIRKKPRILIVLEGRDKEALSSANILGAAPTSAIFEEFAEEIHDGLIAVPPMTTVETLHFIDFLFEQRCKANDPLDAHTLRREQDLKNHIWRRAAGNPMHIIELSDI